MLEYEPEKPREIEPLMGWTSSGDMKWQMRLRFGDKEEAIAYAKRMALPIASRSRSRMDAPYPVLCGQFRTEPVVAMVALSLT